MRLPSSQLRRRMTSLAVPVAPSFEEYRAFKLAYLESNAVKSFTRLDCMKPPSALSHLLHPRPIFHDTDANMHDISARVISQWCSVARCNPAQTILTKGVRDAIYLSFLCLSDITKTIVLPEDVYPVYQKLVSKSVPAAAQVTYPSLSDKNFDILNTIIGDAVLLLPYPVTPRGSLLSPAHLEQLVDWVQQHNRSIVLDCVYSYDLAANYNDLRPLLNTQRVVLCHSMAKAWVSPVLEHPLGDTRLEPREAFSRGVGFVHSYNAPLLRSIEEKCKDLNMQPSTAALHQANYTLQQQAALPQEQQTRFQSQWKHLTSIIEKHVASFAPPSTGYFTTLPVSYAALLEKDVVAVPASVFGSSNAELSVISCLYDIKAMDQQKRNKEPASFPMYHVTVLSNFIRAFDKYSRLYDKELIAQSTYPNQFFVLFSHQLGIGVDKASRLLQKLNIDGDKLLILETSISSNQLVSHPRGQYLETSRIPITGLSVIDQKAIRKISIEEASALSLQLNQPSLQSYAALTPRSISILPIAKGCQAKCPFCFSKGSASDVTKQKRLPDDTIQRVLSAAHASGAERAVITGGGEPFMLPFDRLLRLVKQCSIFPTVCMITNGYYLANMSQEKCIAALTSLDENGLTVLSISRHAATDEANSKLMYLNTQSLRVATTWAECMRNNMFRHLTRLRWVCVLQKGGVECLSSLYEYLDFAAASGVPEICFKELYVSTSVESLFYTAESNKWSEEHQVPLSLIISFCHKHGFTKTAELPWGASIYEGTWNCAPLRIAAYTEPSVFWERSNGVCRSWNLMADGTLLASLEDTKSVIHVPE